MPSSTHIGAVFVARFERQQKPTKFNLKSTTMQLKHLGTLLATAVVVLSTLTLGSCGNKHRWNEQQRREAREMIRQWREITYLNALSEAEFELFTTNVTDLLEAEWPSYVEFIEMPMVGDSVEMVVVAAIVTEIKASPERLQRIFSYPELIDSDILPEGLNKQQLHNFYKCFADKVNMTYGSMHQFVWDAIYSQLDDRLIAQMMRQCAAPFWDVSMTIVEIE